MKTTRSNAIFVWLTICSLLVGSEVLAKPIDDADALRGVTTGKGLFLIDFNDPKKTAFYLDIIQGTYHGMQRQGVKPEFIIVFIGPTVRFLTTRPEEDLLLEYETTLKDIAQSVKTLNELGVKLEICAVATRVFQIDNTTVLPELKVVGDGFISLIGYQTQGYHLVPLF